MSAFARLALVALSAPTRQQPIRDGDPYLEELAMSALAALERTPPAASEPTDPLPAARVHPILEQAPATPHRGGLMDRARAASIL